MPEEYLFCKCDLSGSLRNQLETVIPKEVDSISEKAFKLTSVDDLVAHIASKMEVEPLTINEANATRSQRETKVDVGRDPRVVNIHGGSIFVDGVEVTVSIPFSGQSELWGMRPNVIGMNLPKGKVERHRINLVFAMRNERVKSELPTDLKQTLESIRKHLSLQREMIEQHNRRLPEVVRQHVERRKRNLDVHAELDEILGIPLAQTPHAPPVTPIPVQRKLVKPLPPIPSTPLEKRFQIEEETYQHILDILRHEGRSFERTPGTFAKLDEEELRDMILSHLNTHYQGRATGETFRKHGKTDINIEHEDRSAFVAECKNWSGPQTLHECVDQIIGYLTWRDVKAAIVIFNKDRAGFSDILEKVEPKLSEHPLFAGFEFPERDGEWACRFKHQDDPGIVMRIRVFIFNLFFQQESK